MPVSSEELKKLTAAQLNDMVKRANALVKVSGSGKAAKAEHLSRLSYMSLKGKAIVGHSNAHILVPRSRTKLDRKKVAEGKIGKVIKKKVADVKSRPKSKEEKIHKVVKATEKAKTVGELEAQRAKLRKLRKQKDQFHLV